MACRAAPRAAAACSAGQGSRQLLTLPALLLLNYAAFSAHLFMGTDGFSPSDVRADIHRDAASTQNSRPQPVRSDVARESKNAPNADHRIPDHEILIQVPGGQGAHILMGNGHKVSGARGCGAQISGGKTARTRESQDSVNPSP